MALGQANGAVVKLLCRSGLELADEGVAGFALDQAADAMLVAMAYHGVDLPMADVAAPEHLRWAFGDMALAGEPAAAVIGAVAFAEAALARSTQMLVQGPTAAAIVLRLSAVEVALCRSHTYIWLFVWLRRSISEWPKPDSSGTLQRTARISLSTALILPWRSLRSLTLSG